MLSNTQMSHNTNADKSKQNRALTGKVTKLLDNFGFIDDSVFFQFSVVKGGVVKVGDKVYCECSYCDHLPFKWNASKVHLIHNNSRTAVQTPQQLSGVSMTEGMRVNTSRNYFANQPKNISFGNQTQFEYSNAQQRGQYFGRNESQNSFSQMKYTSSPGLSFISSVPPFRQQIPQNIMQSQARITPQNNFRLARDERLIRSENSYRNNDRPRFGDNFRKRRDVERERVSFGRGIDNERLEKERRMKGSEPQNSINSQSVIRVIERRHYDPINIPKLSTLKNPLNIYDIKQRYFSHLPIPSDLKEVVINTEFSLDIRDIPKPITFRVIELDDNQKNVAKDDNKVNGKPQVMEVEDNRNKIDENVIDLTDNENNGQKNESQIKCDDNNEKNVSKDENKDSDEPQVMEVEDNSSATDAKVIDLTENENNDQNNDKCVNSEEINEKNEAKDENKDENIDKDNLQEMEVEDNNCLNGAKDNASPEEPICVKPIHEYGVKVLIISLPSMKDIYERVFGSHFDAISTGNKAYFLHFNKLLAFLVSRNENDGFSLIGGKFDPQLDGFLPDSNEPNLIETAIRVVAEQTSMNLKNCLKWKLIATFVYNRENSYDPINPSLEFTRVYMPDIQSAFESIYDLHNDNNEKNSDNIDEELIAISEENETQIISDISNNISGPQNELQKESSTITTQPQPSAKVESTVDLSHSNPSESDKTIDLTAGTAFSPPIVDLITLDNSPPHVLTPKDSLTTITPEIDSEVNKTDSADTPTVAESTLSESVVKSVVSDDTSDLSQLLSKMNDMTANELRTELDNRGAKYKRTLKKTELVKKLREVINDLLKGEDVVGVEVENNDNENNDNENNDNESNDNENKIEQKDEQKDEQKEKVEEIEKQLVITIGDNIEKEVIELIDESDDCVIDENNSQMSVDKNAVDNDGKKDEENVVEIIDIQMESQESEKPGNGPQKSENGTTKRKSDSGSPGIMAKNAKNSNESQELFPKEVVDGCVYLKGGESLAVISLHDSLNHQIYDQFEMSIVSEIIRESLIRHFSHYILSSLVYNHLNPVPKEEKIIPDSKTQLEVNYVHLSFAYFDSSHCGHILSEDLAKLLNNADFNLSKNAFNLIVNNEEKVFYKDLKQPNDLIEIKRTNSEVNSNTTKDTFNESENKIVENDGTVYDINRLIELSESDQKLKIRLNEELEQKKDRIDKFSEYINELENKDKKSSEIIQKLNEEITSLKTERDINKYKYDSMRKVVEISCKSFTDILKIQNE